MRIIAAGTDGGVYNVCDNYPALPQDVIDMLPNCLD